MRGHILEVLGRQQKRGMSVLYRLLTETAISEIYQKLLEDPNQNLSQLERIARKDLEKEGENLTGIIRALLKNSAQAKERAANWVYAMSQREDVELSEEENVGVRQPIIEKFSPRRLEELLPDSELQLKWAKKHVDDAPIKAYQIFCKRNYEGKETLDAVRIGFQKGDWKTDYIHRKLGIGDIREGHLRKIYDQLIPAERVEIARPWKDKEKPRKLSKGYVKWESDFQKAYSLWGEGEGDLESQHIRRVRRKLIEAAMVPEKIRSYGLNSPFEETDRAGHIQVYNAIKDQFPKEAYKTARKLSDDQLIGEARESAITNLPLSKARELFLCSQDRNGQEGDCIGMELLVDRVVEQYGADRETIFYYLSTE